MNFSTYRFTLDLQKHQSQVSIACFRYDSAIKLIISLTDGGNPYFIAEGCSAKLYGKKADGTPIVHNCILEGNTKDGYTKIVYVFNELTASEIGIVECKIRLYQGAKEIITAPRFNIVVDERLVTESDLDLGEDAYLYKQDLESLDEIIGNEEQRKANEIQRVANEESRETRLTAVENSKVDKTEVSTEAEANKIVQRDEHGGIKVPADLTAESLDEGSVLPKKYIEEKLKGKIDKAPAETGPVVYASDSGNYGWVDICPGNIVPTVDNQWSIVQRDENANIKLPAGQADVGYSDAVPNYLFKKVEKRVEQLESTTLTHSLVSANGENIVPVNSGMYSYVKQVGGMTYRVRTSGNILVSTELGGFPSGGASVDANGDVTHTSGSGDHCYLWTGELSEGMYVYEIVMSKGTFFKCHLGQENEYGYFNSTTTLNGTKGEFAATNGQRFAIEFEGESDNDYINSYAIFKIALFETRVLANTKVSKIESIGANLFNQMSLNENSDYFSINEKGVTLNKAYNINWLNVPYIIELEAGDYTIHAENQDVCRIQVYSADDAKTIKETAKGVATFNISKKTSVKIKILAASGISYPVFVGNVMFNRGTTAIPYKPYSAEPIDTIEILRSRESYGREFTYLEYKDNKWLWHDDSYTYSFTGDEKKANGGNIWSYAPNNNDTYRFYVKPEDFKFPTLEEISNPFVMNVGICNLYELNDDWNKRTSGNAGEFFVHDSGTIVFLTDNSDLSIGANWINYVKKLYQNGTPLTFTVKLANPPEPEDATSLFTEGNELIVEGGGVVRYVDEDGNECDVPNTMYYVTHKE